jgi:AraC-like DNA-binding protein
MSTRIYKEQSIPEATHPATELIRTFSSLVEQNYKQGHSVSFYADLLNKSPKTITNLFAQAHYQSPSEIIQERLHLEAVRLLKYTDKSIKEIAFELGYEDLPSFSRFFRNKSGQSPRDFRVQTTT